MGRTFEPHFPEQSATRPRIDVDQVPQDVRDEVEEAITWFANPANAGGVLRFTFESNEEKQQWIGQAHSYALSRKQKGRDLDSGPWVLKPSPGRKSNDKPGFLQFRMIRKDQYDALQEETRRNREAAKAANGSQESAA